jgi:hypothetical protein
MTTAELPRYTIRGRVLDEARQLTTGDRNVTYGPPDADFARTAGMLNSLFSHKLSSPLLPQDVAKIVMCIKLSRSVWNEKRDNYVDLAGYAACGWECVELERQRLLESQGLPKEEMVPPETDAIQLGIYHGDE